MITPEQLEVLRDIFNQSDDEFLCSHLTVSVANGVLTVEHDDPNDQDIAQLA